MVELTLVFFESALEALFGPIVLIVFVFSSLIKQRWFLRIFLIKVRTSICNHKTRIRGKVRAKGRVFHKDLKIFNGSPLYCHECLGHLAIECAWCDELILYEEKTKLYQPCTDKYLLPLKFKMFFKDPDYLFGCNRESCYGPEISKHFGFFLVKEKGQRHQHLKNRVLLEKMSKLKKVKQ